MGKSPKEADVALNEEQQRIASAYSELAKHPSAQTVFDDLTTFAGSLPIEQATGAWALLGRVFLRASALRRDRSRAVTATKTRGDG
jgi:hypothetical protein